MLPNIAYGITTTHHDVGKQQQPINTNPKKLPSTLTIPASERQKRLLPYYNFYLEHDFNRPSQQHKNRPKTGPTSKPIYQNYYQQKPNVKFTPFLESNALPGPFIPMIKSQSTTPSQYQVSNVPNYSEIYDKLSQLKLIQQNAASRPQSFTQTYRVIPQYLTQNYDDIKPVYEETSPKPIQPTKTIVRTYTPTSIEISSVASQQPYEEEGEYGTLSSTSTPLEEISQTPKTFLKPVKQYQPVYILSSHLDHLPVSLEDQLQYENDKNQYADITKTQLKKPLIVYPQKEYIEEDLANTRGQIQRPIVYIRPRPHLYHSKIKTIQPETIISTTEATYIPLPETPSTLSTILKKLQESNTLPQTITPDNIDNSIKTLVKILSALKKQQKFTKPIVVLDESAEYQDEVENEAGVGLGGHHVEETPGTVIQTFPAITQEGGTPGKPGVDYPALSTIPQTSFSCKTQRYKGFFGDPDTNCQVSLNFYYSRYEVRRLLKFSRRIIYLSRQLSFVLFPNSS